MRGLECKDFKTRSDGGGGGSVDDVLRINDCRTLNTVFDCRLCLARSQPEFPGFMAEGNITRPPHLIGGGKACYSHVFPDKGNQWGEGFACGAKRPGFSRLCPCHYKLDSIVMPFLSFDAKLDPTRRQMADDDNDAGGGWLSWLISPFH